jgi:hypothetical protein
MDNKMNHDSENTTIKKEEVKDEFLFLHKSIVLMYLRGTISKPLLLEGYSDDQLKDFALTIETKNKTVLPTISESCCGKGCCFKS